MQVGEEKRNARVGMVATPRCALANIYWYAYSQTFLVEFTNYLLAEFRVHKIYRVYDKFKDFCQI